MRSFLLILFVIFGHTASSQDINPVLQNPPFICCYYSETIPETITTFNSVDQARTIIGNIVSIVGLRPNFEIRAADIPNAAAVIHNNKRFILYNPRFVERLNKTAANNWASVSILAHEIGHHLNGHTLSETGNRTDIELEAEEFSGFVLRKMGASLHDAQIAMKIASGIKASHTHPGKADRLEAIKNGWTNAENQLAGKITVPKTNKQIEKPVIVPDAKQENQAALAEKFIAYEVNFTADSIGKYFITIRNNLVKVAGKNLYIAGTMTNSNRKKYARMIYDKHYNYLYITRNGEIVNGDAKVIGRLQLHQ